MSSQRVGPIWVQTLDNDREALDRVFSIHRARLYKLALRMMGNPADAEDVLQDGLLSAYVHLNQFRGRAQLSTWLSRIVLNAALMRIRRRCVVTTSIDDPLRHFEQPSAMRISNPGANPEEICVRTEQLRILEQAVDRLSPTLRRAFWLRDVRGMSTKEAAEASGVPMGSIKVQLHRARTKLRKELAKPRRVRRIGRSTHTALSVTLRQSDSAFREGVDERSGREK
jgi:RNA polymerase sigma-70 factor, ECF subfamily